MTQEESNAGGPRIVITQCTSDKRNRPMEAQDLYMESDYFSKQRPYAKAAGDYWYIQSAKHGLLHPEEEIAPYDKTPDDIDDLDAWGEEIADDIEERHDGGVVEILGGRKYADPLTPALEARGFDVVEPLRGLRIGSRMTRLDDMANQSLGGFA